MENKILECIPRSIVIQKGLEQRGIGDVLESAIITNVRKNNRLLENVGKKSTEDFTYIGDKSNIM